MAGLDGIGGGGGRGKDADTTKASPEFDLPVSGKGGGGGTATGISSDSVCEDDATSLDDAADKGILGPEGQHQKQKKA